MKVLSNIAKLAAVSIAVIGMASGAAFADEFRAVGNGARDWDGTTLRIRSLDSGNSYTFYGTARSCPDGWGGAPYDKMSYIMNGNPFTARIRRCGQNLVEVCANDGVSSACSGYAIRHEGGWY